MRNYDDWKLANGLEGEKIAFDCEHCWKEVYVGERYIYVDITGQKIHEDCFDSFIKDFVQFRVARQGGS